VKAIRRFNVRTVLPEPIAALGDLALNLHWSWHPSTRDLFKSIDPVRWDECHQDPTKMLARLSAAELATLANDAEFVARVDVAKAALDHYLEAPRWYQEWAAAQVTEESPGAPRAIAYFSPSSASPTCCRSTPAAWASSRVTTSSRRPTSACRSSASACSTGPATSSSRSTS
jgi:starch phosphorylase